MTTFDASGRKGDTYDISSGGIRSTYKGKDGRTNTVTGRNMEEVLGKMRSGQD
jgi:hypothetical protein